MNFLEKLLTLRKAKGMTQEQLAEKLDVARQSISKLRMTFSFFMKRT